MSGPQGKMLLTNGQHVEVSAVEKSALTSNMVVLTSIQAQNQQVVSLSGQRVLFEVQAYGAISGTTFVAVVQAAEGYELLGADRQPVQTLGVLVSELVN
jgi:hypothetical protein